MNTNQQNRLGKGLKGIGVVFLLIALSETMTPVFADTPPYTPEGFDSFAGTGFAPSPAAGQLDSDTWALNGLSDGDTAWGGTYTTGDYARGIDEDGASTGGIYAFDVVSGAGTDYILGVQPTDADFTPGAIYLRLHVTIAHSRRQSFDKSTFRNFLPQIHTV
jgi:hypothetical protein